MLTHAARAAAKQLNKAPLVAARGAREGLWLELKSTRPRCARQARQRLANPSIHFKKKFGCCAVIFYRHCLQLHGSPNQVLTHAARATAKQPFQPPLVAARRLPNVAWPAARSAALLAFCRRQHETKREGLWLEQPVRRMPGPRSAIDRQKTRRGVATS